MVKWIVFFYDNSVFVYMLVMLKKYWVWLYVGDVELFLKDVVVVQVWIYFYVGEFQVVYDVGLVVGGVGIMVVNKVQGIYVNYFEKKEKVKFEMFLEIFEWVEVQQVEEFKNLNVWYWQVYVIGCYGQGISVVKVLV